MMNQVSGLRLKKKYNYGTRMRGNKIYVSLDRIIKKNVKTKNMNLSSGVYTQFIIIYINLSTSSLNVA